MPRNLLDSFPDGVWFVDLAPLSDPSLVPQAVALALDVREVPGRPMLTTLLEVLRTRSVLLLLDNCELLIDACAQLADAVLQNCGQVRILATSRELLGVRGETTLRVPSLALPDSRATPSVEDLRQNEAVRLFVDRARAVVPGFGVTQENAAALARVCQRLDGISLAIELAAARLLGGSEGLAMGIGDRVIPEPEPVRRAQHARVEAAARELLGEEAFAALRAEGRRLGLEEVVRLALADLEPLPRLAVRARR